MAIGRTEGDEGVAVQKGHEVNTILLIDDHALVREGLAQTLKRLGEDWQVLEAGDADAALNLLDTRDDVEVVITDLMLPGMNGFSLLALLRRRTPELPVIVVSSLEDRPTIARALKQGALGFVSKSCSGADLLEAVRCVLAGEIYTPRERPVPNRVRIGRTSGKGKLDSAKRYGLTNAQARVLDMLAEGRSNRDIAEGLGLTEGTVKVHVSRILRALSVSSRAQVLLKLERDRSGASL